MLRLNIQKYIWYIKLLYEIRIILNIKIYVY